MDPVLQEEDTISQEQNQGRARPSSLLSCCITGTKLPCFLIRCSAMGRGFLKARIRAIDTVHTLGWYVGKRDATADFFLRYGNAPHLRRGSSFPTGIRVPILHINNPP